MTDTAPERIAVRVDYDGEVDGTWVGENMPRPYGFDDNATEYIRADLVAAKDAEIERLRVVCEKWCELVQQTFDQKIFDFGDANSMVNFQQGLNETRAALEGESE